LSLNIGRPLFEETDPTSHLPLFLSPKPDLLGSMIDDLPTGGHLEIIAPISLQVPGRNVYARLELRIDSYSIHPSNMIHHGYKLFVLYLLYNIRLMNLSKFGRQGNSKFLATNGLTSTTSAATPSTAAAHCRKNRTHHCCSQNHSIIY